MSMMLIVSLVAYLATGVLFIKCLSAIHFFDNVKEGRTIDFVRSMLGSAALLWPLYMVVVVGVVVLAGMGWLVGRIGNLE